MKREDNHEIELAKWLATLREEAGISQEFLGTQIGKGQSDIAKIENGSKKLTVMELLLWLSALDIPYSRFQEGLGLLYEKVHGKRSLWKRHEG